MKKFLYKLSSILAIREHQRELRQAELSRARADLASEVAELERICATLQRAIAWRPADDGLVSATFLHQREVHLLALRGQREAQQGRVEEAEARVERCRTALQAATVELRKMEKHREREKARWDVEFKRREMAAIDDIVNARGGHLQPVT